MIVPAPIATTTMAASIISHFFLEDERISSSLFDNIGET
jgi:hypothetical protein